MDVERGGDHQVAMNILLFGGTGMVGQGALRECLLDADVTCVISLVRKPTEQRDPKLRELVLADFFDYSGVEAQLTGLDACFFCLGVSSAGMTEADYRRTTFDLTLAAGRVLARLNPQMTFLYVSGLGTDSSERGRTLWARVKGETENALLALPFKAYMFRPGVILPMHGVKSKTRIYQIFYDVLGPLLPVLRALFPKYVTTTQQLGQAMLKVAKKGASKRVLESADILDQ